MTDKQNTIALFIHQRQHQERRAALLLSMIERLQTEHRMCEHVIATVSKAMARYERQPDVPQTWFEVVA